METRGARLRQFLLEKTGGKHGWVKQLTAESGVKRQTLSAWMGDRAKPDLESLYALAGALGVRPYEVIAAMDGDVVVPVDRAREMIREEVERYARGEDREPPRAFRG